MAKGSSRIALYELVNKARFKSAQQKVLADVEYRKSGQMPATGAEPKPELNAEKAESPVIQSPVDEAVISKPSAVWNVRPKAVRIYPDRIEMCFSWQTAIIGLLALVTILLVFFRLGQIYSLKKSEAKKTPQAAAVENIMPQAKPSQAANADKQSAAPKMVEPMGNNIIVIASHPLSSHLEPVKQYFAGFGITTEIIKKDNRFMLVTQERFDNVEKPGSDGLEMRKKIIAIGANYKPPASSGFEPFGPKPFQDAYGMKTN
ncbi:MAG: hypothetical protein NTW93_05250 [Phycisphaerae bacterium]|nr:hypothetical protein [Phycisphaerae bacterium]